MLGIVLVFLAVVLHLSEALVLPNAEQLVLFEQSSLSGESKELQRDQACSQRIAVIGSGITGAVTAYRLSEGYRLQRLPAERPCITVFERNPVIGGRITQTYVYGDPRYPIDTCATTFSPADSCLVSALTDLGLTIVPDALVRPIAGTGVWDGQKIIGFVDQDGFRDPPLWSFFKQSKWSQRYKLAPITFNSYALQARLSFDQLLPSPLITLPRTMLPGRKNLSQELERTMTAQYLQSPLCSNITFEREGEQEFLAEAVLPGLRERYFIDDPGFNLLDLYFGFNEVLPSFVENGNLKLVERLLQLSGAEVRVRTEVQEVRSQELSGSPTFLVSSRDLFDGTSKTEQFGTVIVATSFDRGNITFEPQLPRAPGLRQEYTNSFVTHFTTPSLLNGMFFNYTDEMPQRILTYNKDQLSVVDDAQIAPDSRPPFFSLTLVGQYPTPQAPQRIEYLFKLVSQSEISDEDIKSYLSQSPDPLRPVISWIHREPLPQSVPLTPVRKDMPCRAFLEDIEIVPGVFYAGGGEQVIASAEFGCRMADNVANLILNGAEEI